MANKKVNDNNNNNSLQGHLPIGKYLPLEDMWKETKCISEVAQKNMMDL
jgi:hypothetical protein